MMTRLILLWLLLLTPLLAEAKSMYSRSSDICANNGDGTAYGCAATPGAVGAWRNLGSIVFGDTATTAGNGDTVYICGLHDVGFQGAAPVQDAEVQTSRAVILDGNCPNDPGTLRSANYRLTSGWTGPDAFGAYSHTGIVGCTGHAIQLVGGVATRLNRAKTGVPDGTWIAGDFYQNCTDTIYLKPLGGVSPNTTTVYTGWGNGGLIRLSTGATVQNLTVQGLSSTFCLSAVTGATDVTFRNNTIKWCHYAAIGVVDSLGVVNVHRGVVDSNIITDSAQGVIVSADTNGERHDAWTVRNNTITDIDVVGFYFDTADHHGIGIAGGNDHHVQDNILARIPGSCITFYDYPGQSMLRPHIIRNTCTDILNPNNIPNMNKFGIEMGSTNSGYVGTDTAGTVITGNLLRNVGSVCFYAKYSAPFAIVNNTAIDCGTGLAFEDFADGNIGFVFANNIISATTNIDHFNNGTDSLAGIQINNNIYLSDGSTSFEWNGTKSAFTAWKTNSSQDANSWQTDPQFYNAAAYDFRTRGTSPARRAGISGYPCIDNRGRPCWSPPDIGAYQATSRDQAAPRTPR